MERSKYLEEFKKLSKKNESIYYWFDNRICYGFKVPVGKKEIYKTSTAFPQIPVSINSKELLFWWEFDVVSLNEMIKQLRKSK